MRFPAACAAVIVASGVLVVHAFPSACGLFLMAGLPASIGLWIWGRSQLRRNITGLAALTFAASGGIALFSGSALNYSSTLTPGFNNLSRWSRPHDPLILTVTGRLQSKVRSRSGRVSYEIDVRSMVFDRLFRDVRGRILIQDWDNASVLDFEVVHPGDLIRTTGELFALAGPRNPFDFDAATFHRRNGISSGFAPTSYEKARVEHRHSGWVYEVGRLRQAILGRIELLHASTAGREILPALLLGDRSLISAESNRAFRSSGLAHLLAISGLHVGIVGFSLFSLSQVVLNRLGVSFVPGLTIRCAATFFILLGYAFLSGGSPSVVRAVTMAGVILLGRALFRKVAGWNALGVAATLALVLWPEGLFSAGFQLSFAAVGGIFVVNETVGKRLESHIARRTDPGVFQRSVVLKRLAESVFISVSVTCGTLPVMLYHFGSAAFGGMLANVFAIPITSLLLISGIFSTLFGSVPFVGELLVSSTDLLSSLLFATALRAADLLGAWSLSTGLWKLTLLGFFPLFLVLGLHGSPRSRAWKISLFFAFFLLHPGTRKAPLRVDILDVGQGDAILITTPSLRTILVDTGGGLSAALAIERHIKGLGLSGIDLLVISHFHQDHVGGLPFLLNRIPITRVAFSSNQRDVYRQNWAPGDGFGRAPLPLTVHRGDTLFVDEQVRILVLAPSGVEEPDSIRHLKSIASEKVRVSENDRTVVLKIVFGETSFLLTGDAELNTEAGLVKDYGNLLSSDVVKLAHHGSSTSSSQPFIIRASKKDGFAAISVGAKNRFGHPATDVIRRWLSHGIRVSATSRSGAISYLSNGQELRFLSVQNQ